MNNIVKSVGNFYVSRSLLVDTVIAFGVTLIFWRLCWRFNICAQSSADVLQDIASELIGASIGVSGFIIASLTIIITMRDNTPNKPLEKHENGMELFFNSPGYGMLTKVYLIAAGESLLIFILFIIAKFYGERIGSSFLSAMVIIALILLVLLVARCVFLLWSVIKIQLNAQKKTKPKEPKAGLEQE